MTRWARGVTNKEHVATQWEEMNNDTTEQHSFKKGKKFNDQLEKKRAARRNRRKKAKPCFHCRKPGHQVADCPQRSVDTEMHAGCICFKCGSTEHTVHQCKAKVEEGEYPFATCFICKQQGHLSSKCPDNPRGLYPEGGGCRFCGSVEHYNKDCTERLKNKTEGGSKKRRLKMMTTDQSADSLVFSDSDDDDTTPKKKVKKSREKIIKF